MKILSSLTTAIHGVRDQAQAIRRNIDRLKARRKELGLLPLPKTDVLSGVLEYIDAREKSWADDALPLMLKPFLSADGARLDVPVIESNGSYHEQNKVHPGAIYGLLGDALKDAIRARIMAMPWPDKVGPTRAERRAEIERIDAELADLESGLKKILAEARTVGVDLDAAANS